MDILTKRLLDYTPIKCNDSAPIQGLIQKMLETTNPYNKSTTVDMAKFYELEKKFT